ncbi:MAG: Fur family transcriptional regulator [Proteobacteria bacterium]|nr:Fur family transcriptional regulator [Pseudomonadota bacterium]
MKNGRTYAEIIDRLRQAGLRPTRQRIALAGLMYSGGDRHLSAEILHGEALRARVPVSLATVYNSLHQFTARGLLREIVIDGGRSYFDTNVSDHHHFYFENEGRLEDIPAEDVVVAALPKAPGRTRISRVDVIVRVRED